MNVEAAGLGRFTAAQAAEKGPGFLVGYRARFTAAQAAEKNQR